MHSVARARFGLLALLVLPVTAPAQSTLPIQVPLARSPSWNTGIDAPLPSWPSLPPGPALPPQSLPAPLPPLTNTRPPVATGMPGSPTPTPTPGVTSINSYRRVDTPESSVTMGMVHVTDGILSPTLPGSGVQVEQRLPGGVQLQATQLRADPVIPAPIPGVDLPSGIQDVNGVSIAWPVKGAVPLRFEGTFMEKENHQGLEPTAGAGDRDRERTQGLKVTAKDPTGRIEVEGGISQSESLAADPEDPVIRPGKQGHRLRGTLHLLKNQTITGDTVANIRLETSQEEILPSAETIPATEKDHLGLVAGVGAVRFTAWQDAARNRGSLAMDRLLVTEGYEIVLPVRELIPIMLPAMDLIPRIVIRQEQAMEGAVPRSDHDDPAPTGAPALDTRDSGRMGLEWEGSRWRFDVERSWSERGEEDPAADDYFRERGVRLELTLEPVGGLEVGTSFTRHHEDHPADETLLREERGIFVGWNMLPGLRLTGRVDRTQLEDPTLEAPSVEDRLTAELRYRSQVFCLGPEASTIEAYLRHSVVGGEATNAPTTTSSGAPTWKSDAGVTLKLF